MKLEIMSQRGAEKEAEILNEKTSIISITCPDEDDVTFADNKNIDKIFRMRFFDVINDVELDDNYYPAPKQEDFTGLKEFVDNLDCERLIVHCRAGYSRSAGVAAAINEYLKLGYKIFGNGRYCPNATAYSCCMKEFGIQRDENYYEGIFGGEKRKLIILIGQPGCGKSTYTNKYKELYDVHSSDLIREELSRREKIKKLKEEGVEFNQSEITGNANDQSVSKAAFEKMYSRTIRSLQNGKDVIYDSCNTSIKARRKLIKTIRQCFGNNVEITGVVFDVPLEESKRRNKIRESEGSIVSDLYGHERKIERKVPDEVIERMYNNLHKNFPSTDEGFDKIEIIENKELKNDEIQK